MLYSSVQLRSFGREIATAVVHSYEGYFSLIQLNSSDELDGVWCKQQIARSRKHTSSVVIISAMYLYPSANNMLNSFFFLEETVQNAA